jgi:hypothetical protein
MAQLLIAGFLVAAGLLAFLVFRRRQNVNTVRTILSAYELIGFSTAIYLSWRYRSKYTEDVAVKLTAALVNRLFGAPPGNEQAKAFLEANRDLIEEEISRLKEDQQLCEVVSVASEVMFRLAARSSSNLTTDRLINAMELKRWGKVPAIPRKHKIGSP